jgi:hypothetical protein
MGIFKNLINKVLDAEVPPVVEQLVKKEQDEKDGPVHEKWDDRKFNKWLKLRENFKIA